MSVIDKFKALEEENERLKAELEQHRWIPVSERLPKEDEQCLVIEGKFAQLGNWQQNTDHLGLQWNVNGFISKQVTHWKPIILPEQI